jgi:hypothetical protein
MASSVPQQRTPVLLWLTCAGCGEERGCLGPRGTMRRAEEISVFSADHSACGAGVLVSDAMTRGL